MIKILIQESAHANQFKVEHSPGFLTSLKKINLFIGENNSGKSKFIRSLQEERWSKANLKFVDEVGEANLVTHYSANYRENLITSLQTLINNFPLLNIRSFEIILSELEHIEEQTDKITAYIKAASIFSRVRPENIVNEEDAINPVLVNRARRMNELGSNMLRLISSNLAPNDTLGDTLYLPILRGLRPIHVSIDPQKKPRFDFTDDYRFRTINDYFDDGTNRSNPIEQKIFSGLDMYEKVTELLLGTVEQRDIIASFEAFVSRYVFDGKRVTLIPKHKDDVLHIKIGEDEQRPVYNLGDGIQAVITILFPLFIRKDKETLVFIEEPEMHLHPTFQRKLVDALLELDKLQYFISTHSSVFLDSRDTCIYRVSKGENQFHLEQISLAEDKRKLLSHMGYKASDVLLSNFVLWVEGPSDKIYFEYWIDQFSNQELVMGKHYDIMMYHGSFKRHVEIEAFKNMSTHFGVYFDSDRASEDADVSQELMEIASTLESMEMFCWVSRKRAIENYIEKDDYLKAASSILRNVNEEDILMGEGDFVNRKFISIRNKPKEFKQRILLPGDVWAKVRQNGDGTTTGIEGRDLRRAVDKAIQQGANQHIKLNEVRLAEEAVKLQPTFHDPELNERIEALSHAIKRANQME